MIRLLVVVLVVVGVGYVGSHAMRSSAAGGSSRVEHAAKELGAKHGIMVDSVSCHESGVKAPSIPNAAQPGASGTTAVLYDCAVGLKSMGMADQTWCVPELPGTDTWLAVTTSCEAWAKGTTSAMDLR